MSSAFDTATTMAVDNNVNATNYNSRQACAYAIKTFIIMLGCGGIALSVLASTQTCEFLRFRSMSELEDTLFAQANVTGWVGIFSYQLDSFLENDNGEQQQQPTGVCMNYEGQFQNAPNAFVVTSQFCAVIAPCLAFVAISMALCELLFCAFPGSFLGATVFFLAAAGVQGGTFAIFAEPTFCFNNNGCDVGTAGIYSACAALAFFLSCLLLCCSPRPYPYFESRGRRHKEEEQETHQYGLEHAGTAETAPDEMDDNVPGITASCTSSPKPSSQEEDA